MSVCFSRVTLFDYTTLAVFSSFWRNKDRIKLSILHKSSAFRQKSIIAVLLHCFDTLEPAHQPYPETIEDPQSSEMILELGYFWN